MTVWQNMKKNKKIIDKICKCLRLAESGNPNEAALALHQAQLMMKKHNISDADVSAAAVNEGVTCAGDRFNPPFWALALANLVATTFACRNLIRRQYGRQPEFRFIGLGVNPEVATYAYSVLYRYLSRAIDAFEEAEQQEKAACRDTEWQRRVQVFAQAWLFRVEQTLRRFVDDSTDTAVMIDDYIQEKYGEAAELSGEAATSCTADYEDILSGLRAGSEVALYRSMGRLAPPLLQHKQAS